MSRDVRYTKMHDKTTFRPTHRRFYCVYGNTVNTSARMMMYAKTGDLCVSQEFAKQAEKAGVRQFHRFDLDKHDVFICCHCSSKSLGGSRWCAENDQKA